MVEAFSTADVVKIAGRSSIYASLITGGVFYLFAISQYFLGNDPIGLGFLVGFAMVAMLWIPAALLGTLVSLFVFFAVQRKKWMITQLVAFGSIAAVGALLGGSLENPGEVSALIVLGLIFGAVSTYFLQRLSKAGSTHG